MDQYLSSMKVSQLKAFVHTLGLSNIGNKSALIDRVLKSDLRRWTMDQLKDPLRFLNLPITGTKNALIKILQQHNSSSEYQKMTNATLKKLLKERKLSTTGVKAVLVKRLEENDADISTQDVLS